jgi:hypothetical protein
MKLEIKHLKDIARNVIVEKKMERVLRQEAAHTFGSRLIESTELEVLAEQVNDLLETFKASGKSVDSKFTTTSLLAFVDNPSVEVRAMIARLLPEGMLPKMVNDKSDVVRHVVASRVGINHLIEMCKRHPSDDQLSLIREERKVESTLSLYHDKPMGSLARSMPLDLSDLWYQTTARKIIQDHGAFTRTPVSLERHWNPLAVKRFVESMRVSSGTEIDEKKLQAAVDEQITEIDENWEGAEKVRFSSFKEAKEYLTKAALEESVMSTPVMVVLEEQESDSLKNLLSSSFTSSEFRKVFESLFHVQFGPPAGDLKKHLIAEGLVQSSLIPKRSKIPEGRVDQIAESVIDRYVRDWNNNSVNVQINWEYRGDDVLFSARVK